MSIIDLHTIEPDGLEHDGDARLSSVSFYICW